jgi:hypothetical protein
MSAYGPKRTSLVAPHMSAFGGKADMAYCGNTLSRSLLGVKRTCRFALHMSAFDPKRTSNLIRGPKPDSRRVSRCCRALCGRVPQRPPRNRLRRRAARDGRVPLAGGPIRSLAGAGGRSGPPTGGTPATISPEAVALCPPALLSSYRNGLVWPQPSGEKPAALM